MIYTIYFFVSLYISFSNKAICSLSPVKIIQTATSGIIAIKKTLLKILIVNPPYDLLHSIIHINNLLCNIFTIKSKYETD